MLTRAAALIMSAVISALSLIPSANGQGDQRLKDSEIRALVAGTKSMGSDGINVAYFNADGSFQIASHKGKWWAKDDMLCTDGAGGGCQTITKKADGSYVRQRTGQGTRTVVFERQ